MKIIFLDVDGVLNYDGCSARCGFYYGVEDSKVELLKKIIDATGAKIVLSSTWRLGFDNKGHRLEDHAKYLKEKLAKYGLEIYGMTPEVGGWHGQRGREIKLWLTAHEETDEWVVLDDEYFDDFPENGIMPHWVETYDLYGLTEEDVEKAINILNGE